MKHRLLILLSLLLSAACSGDLGNYVYTELEEPQIGGINAEYTVLAHSRLVIIPDFEPESFDDPERYSYSWKALGKGYTAALQTLSEERNLNWAVELPAGSYTLYFRITDRSSGIFWQTQSALEIRETTSKGWMALCRGASDEADLQMYSEVTSKVYKGLLDNSGIPAAVGPRAIQWSYYADSQSPFYLLCDNVSTRLSREGFAWSEEYMLRYEMGAGGEPLAECICDGAACKLMIADGQAYYASCQLGVGLFASVKGTSDLAPFIGVNACTKSIVVPVFLFYDTEGKRFMAYSPNLGSSDVGGYETLWEINGLVDFLGSMPSGGEVTGSAFASFPQGMELLTMQNSTYDPSGSNMGVTYSLLREGSRFELYGVQLGELWGAVQIGDCAYALGKAVYADLSECSRISEASCYAFSPLRSAMYYSVGGDLYFVDLSAAAPGAELQLSLSGEMICDLEWHGYDLAVASLKGENGTIRIYEGFDSDGDFSSVNPQKLEGFGEIADICYRELEY